MFDLTEFFLLASAHLLAVASPGPDFAVVLKHSLVHGRAVAVWTSIGIGAGILLHVAYSLLGIGLVISQSTFAFNLMKWAAAAYLLWLGINALRSKPQTAQTESDDREFGDVPSAAKAFTIGFVTNALNPKATLFFLSLFTVIVSATTPTTVKLSYGIYLSLATMAWFTLLSMVLGSNRVRQWLRRSAHWIDRGMGVVLIALAARLALASR